MKAALARYRSKPDEISPKVSREEAKLKEAKWAQRHSDLEAKLHSLSRLRDSPTSQDDSREVQDSLQLESRRIRELQDQVKVLKSRNEHLEKTNKSLTLLLVDKDAVVSRYTSDILKLRSEVERLSKSSAKKDSLVDFNSADFRDFVGDDDILEEWPAAKPNAPVGKDPQVRASNNTFEFEDSRFSLNSWKQSRPSSELKSKDRGSDLKREELLTRTGTFGEEQSRAETRKLELEIERLREMLESAERELIGEKQERALSADARRRLEDDCDALRAANAHLQKQLDSPTNARRLNAGDNSLIASLQSELADARTLISSLQGELEQLRSEGNPFAPPQQDASTLQAIQQLSMIILSKDKSSIVDPGTKSLVQRVFGDNFSNLVSAYEQKVSKLEEEVKDVREVYRSELQKHVKHLEVLQDTIDFLVNLNRQSLEDEDYLREMLTESEQRHVALQEEVATALTETKLVYEEMGVMSIRNSEYSSPAKRPAYQSVNGELEQMRTKVSLLTSENVSLLQKTRILQSRETDLERARKAITEHKAEARKLVTENEKLKQDLTQALTSNASLNSALQRLEYKHKSEVSVEDLFALMQTQASVVEEILNQQSQGEALEDFDENFEL